MESWLQNLSPDTAVIVPTRSLVNHLTERLAKHCLDQNMAVWESPNILLWSDYLKLLWQLNQEKMAECNGAHSLISTQQSLLLWTQVIEASRRKERALTLLNVQQTAKAVQRSWRLMHDWQVPLDQIKQDHVADSQQFVEWLESYQHLLVKRGFTDEATLTAWLLNNDHDLPYKKSLIWYSYDLVTASQHAANNYASNKGVDVVFRALDRQHDQTIDYFSYATNRDELIETFHSARRCLAANPKSKINIVIPDLQHRQAHVRELAREVFYPSLSPLQVQQQSNVYRFSLGEPLQQWPAIEVALMVIKLLKNRIKCAEFSFILRNRFLRLSAQNWQECEMFDAWLKRRRYSVINTDQLAELYRQCLLEQSDVSIVNEDDSKLLPALITLVKFFVELKQDLVKARDDSGYAGFPFSTWVRRIETWLDFWGWGTSIVGEEMNSVQFQLRERWLSLLHEYALLDAVQGQAGVNRALEIFQMMAFEGIFQPQAQATPILISGVFEAIGQRVDVCYLSGMNQNYPVPAQNDVFVANRILINTGYPDANAITGLEQAKRVITSLVAPAEKVVVSFAREDQQNREIENNVSSIFREQSFIEQTPIARDKVNVELDEYQDIQGPSWPSDRILRGGANIFTNQSNCAFKAFVTHQLKFSSDEESEFGLDALDRGNVVHHLLEWLWGELQTQQRLLAMSEPEQSDLIQRGIEIVISEFEAHLNADKFELLQLEAPRLQKIAEEWLAIEVQRPSPFTVLEREEMRDGEVGGINFSYKIDRLDILEDGRTIVIDYKTGIVAKKDWLGERIRNPQLPLYAVALNKEKRKDVSGIAFAQVKRLGSKYEFLGEADIFKTQSSHATKTEDSWIESSAQWPQIMEKLGKDFLAGQAQVNPIDAVICNYCELASMCRVSQLSDGLFADGDETDQAYGVSNDQ